MSEALANNPAENPQEASHEADVYDLARTQELNEVMDQYNAYQPGSVAEAVEAVNGVNSLESSLVENEGHYFVGDKQIGKLAAERVRAASETGLNAWKLDQEQAASVKKIADGTRPEDIPYKSWLGMTKHEKASVAAAAAQKLELSKDITKYQSEQENQAAKEHKATHASKAAELRQKRETLKSEKMEAEKQRVADMAYDQKRAELEVVREQRVAEALDKAGHIQGNARTMLEANLRTRFDRDVEDAAALAAETAATNREQFVNANGGPAAIEAIRAQEKEAADKEAFLRNLHGDREYEKRYGKNDPAGAVEVDKPADTERPDGVSYKEWLEMTPLERKASADSATEMPADVTEDFWNSLPNAVKRHWSGLNDEEKQNLRNHLAAENTASEWGETTLIDTNERTFDFSPKAMKARFNRLMGAAWVKLQMLKTSTTEYYSDEEKGSKRRSIIGAAAAVVAVGSVVAVGILEARGHSTGHTGVKANHSGTGNAGRHTGSVGSHGRVAGAAKPSALNYQNVELKPGTNNSLWHEEALHHPHASQHEIYERVQHDMAMNHIKNEEEAEHMSGVFKITR